MKLEQTPVRHTRFGPGTVLRCENGMVTVAFPTAGEKQFVFPDSFQKFLRCEDPAQAAAIAEYIILKKAEENAILREQEAARQAAFAAREAARQTRPKTKKA